MHQSCLSREGTEDLVVFYDASCQGLGCMMLQGNKAIAYAPMQLHPNEANDTYHDLRLGAVVSSLKNWRHYQYGTKCVVFINHKILIHIFYQKELNIGQ